MSRPHTLLITPHACARSKAIGSVRPFVGLFVCHHKNRQIRKSTHHSEMQVSLQYRQGRKCTFFAFQALERGHECYKSTSHAFVPWATPSYAMRHVLPQPRMLEISVGKDRRRQARKLMYACSSAHGIRMQLHLQRQCMHARGVCALDSSSYGSYYQARSSYTFFASLAVTDLCTWILTIVLTFMYLFNRYMKVKVATKACSIQLKI